MISPERIKEIESKAELWQNHAPGEFVNFTEELLDERKQLVAIVEVVEKMFSSKAGLNDLDLLNEALKAWRGND